MKWEEQQLTTPFGNLYYSKINASKEKPLFVFLSGMGDFNTQENYCKVLDLLPEGVQSLTLDYLNCGKSGDVTQKYTFAEEIQAMSTIINQQQAPHVFLVAHSLGGIYAAELSPFIQNLRGFIGIEPTTREIILNPPQTAAYQAALASVSEVPKEEREKRFYQKAQENLGPTQASQLFATAKESEDRPQVSHDFFNEMIMSYDLEKPAILFPETVTTILISQAYRKEEMARSEYLTTAPGSKVLTGGSDHYLHWERADLVIQAVNELLAVQ